jgi:hypothetical protein
VRTLLAVPAVCLACVPALAVDAFVYPPESTVKFACSVSHDTVTVTLTSDGLLPTFDIYISDHTVNSPQLFECRVDGLLQNDLVPEIDSIFDGVRTTRWVIDQFQSELSLKYYVPSYFNSQLNWVAFQDGPVFGLVVDTVCCSGTTGNINNDPANMTDLADLSMLIGYLTGIPYNLNCPAEANIDGSSSGEIDLTDLALLIGYLVQGQTLPACP